MRTRPSSSTPGMAGQAEPAVKRSGSGWDVGSLWAIASRLHPDGEDSVEVVP